MDLRNVGNRSIITDSSGSNAMVGIFGEVLATDIRNDVLVQFQYNIADRDVITGLVDTGTVTQSDHMCVVSTGAGTDAEAHVYSVQTTRYRPGHTSICHFTAMFETGPVPNTLQRVGLINDVDGIFIGCNDTNRFVGYEYDGTTTYIEEDNWNGDPRVRQFDWTALNVYRIKYGWLGAAPIVFQMQLPGTLEWVDIHRTIEQGTLVHPHIGNPALPVQIDIVKTGADATDVVIKSGSWQAGTLGLCGTCGNRPFQDAQVKAAVTTTPTVVAVYRNKDTFFGKINKVRAQLLRYQFHIDSPSSLNDFGTVRFRLIANPTLAGTPAWADINTNNSIIEVDTAQTYVGGGEVGYTEYHSYAGGKGNSVPSASVDAEQFNLILYPGNTYALVADIVYSQGTASADVRHAFNWVELF